MLRFVNTCRAESGSTLIEILIAILILSVAVLGYTRTQTLGLRSNTNAGLRSQATTLANDLAERMRANRPAAKSGAYADVAYDSIDCTATPAKYCSDLAGHAAENCDEDEIALDDAIAWACSVRSTIPNASVSVTWDGIRYTQSIDWTVTGLAGTGANKSLTMLILP